MNEQNPFDEMFKELEKSIEGIIADKNFWKEVGNFAVDLIRKRTRLGYGVAQTGAEKVKLDEMRVLAPEYIEYRKYLRENGELADTTNPKKNNLTLSGEMLDELKCFVISEMVMIGFIPNSMAKKKAGWCKDKGKIFNFLSSSELKQIRNYVQKQMEERLKKFLS